MKTIVIALAWPFWVAVEIHAASPEEWTAAAVIKTEAGVKAKVNALFGNRSDNPPGRS